MTKVIYVLTGANGFLGNTIARKLAEKEEVRCLVLPGTSREALKGVSCRIVEGDVTKPESLDALFEDGEDASFIMLHCASIVYTRSKYHPEVEHVNIEGVRHVVAKALQYHAKLIYVSSVHAIPEKPKPQMIQETKEFDPDLVQGLYAKTKAAGSRIVMDAIRKEGLEGIIVHPSGIIGPAIMATAI